MKKSERPNILFITSDQHHWTSMGIRNPEVRTPNLDKLAATGRLFDRAYTVNPTCTPTRASLITGQYPSQHGAYSLGTKLPDNVHTVGDDFRCHGYRTGLVGKAHFHPLSSRGEHISLEAYPILQDLEFWRSFRGPWYGFDTIDLARNHTDEAHVGQHYALWLEENGCENWRDHFRKPTGYTDGEKRTWSIPEKYHYDAWIADRTNVLLEEYKANEESFFLWASFFDPHPSYLVPEPWDKMYDPEKLTVPRFVEGEFDDMPPHFKETQKPWGEADFSAYHEPDGNALHGFHSHVHEEKELRKDIAVYYGMVSLMDKYIGKILDKLEALGLADNTIVIFTTDHGHFFGHHGLIAKGAFHYEDMIKVPFIVRWPGQQQQGTCSDALQSLVDIPVTCLKACGIQPPRSMTGLDQSAVWRGETQRIRDHVVVENRHNPTTVHVKTLIDERYKLTVYYNQAYGELFDLREDPGELKNQWENPDYATVKANLLLKFMHAEMGKEPLWMPRIAGA